MNSKHNKAPHEKRAALLLIAEGYSLAEFRARRRESNAIVFCRDMCVAENTLRGVSVELSAISGQPRRRAKRILR